MIAGVAALGAGWALTVVFGDLWRLARRVRAGAHSVASFPDGGEGWIRGGVELADNGILSELGLQPCVCYRVEVTTLGTSYLEVCNGVPFFVVDETGRALVQPDVVRLEAPWSYQSGSGTESRTPSQLEIAFLARRGDSPTRWSGHKMLLYREAVVRVGDVVQVLGEGVHEPDSDPRRMGEGYRSGPPQRLRMRGTWRKPLVIRCEPRSSPQLPGGHASP